MILLERSEIAPAGALVQNRGLRAATVLPDFDFETYSDAGYVWREDVEKWASLPNVDKKGIVITGAAAYAEHGSTEVVSLAYDLKDGRGPRLWFPGMPDPVDLFNHITSGGILEAHNSAFEYFIWKYVCVRKMGWPPLNFLQLRDSAAKCAAWSLPTSLDKAGAALGVQDQKIKEGKRLIQKFSCPRNPTKTNPARRLLAEEDDVDGVAFYRYNLGDIKTESQISRSVPDLSPEELELWLTDQEANFRGVTMDMKSVEALARVLEEVTRQRLSDLLHITGGLVKSANEVAQMRGWLSNCCGVIAPDLKADTVKDLLKRKDIPESAREVLKIRAELSSNSVKKLFSIRYRTNKDGRLRGLFQYCGADRTGRWAGRGPQPQNLPNSGPPMSTCDSCGTHLSGEYVGAPCSCGGEYKEREWSVEDVERFLGAIGEKEDTGTFPCSLDYIKMYFGDPIKCISGSLRGLFIAAPGHDLICSDYSAIEAVVLAALAGEEWRMEVFRTHGKIYEMSAAKISNEVTFEDMMRYKEETGNHHPLRKKIGKVAELASGYQGGVGAWLQFGADKAMEEPEDRKLPEDLRKPVIENRINAAKNKWRRESPNIVKFWYAVEECAINAVSNPGVNYEYRGLKFGCYGDVLYIRLLSGRTLNYHEPRLIPVKRFGRDSLQLSFMGVDSKTKRWMRDTTYGGKITENITQATARDIMGHALVKANKSGYKVVMHIHDEAVVEVPEGWGTVEEFEQIMATLPAWCEDWPIRAAGGWRGKRYRKD